MEKHFPKNNVNMENMISDMQKGTLYDILAKKNDMFNDILAQQLMIFLPKINNIFFEKLLFQNITIVKNIVILLEKY